MKINSIHRITISIVSLCVAAILIANVVGIIPDERVATAQQRANQCESLASNMTYLIGKHELHQAAKQLEMFQAQHAELISAGLRFNDGKLVGQVGDHRSTWTSAMTNSQDGCYVLPIVSAKGQWGTLEMRFQPIFVGYNRWLSTSTVQLLILLVPLVGGACLFHLRQILKYLDPGQVVPSRVRQTLDNFAEGVVLLDGEDRIVLANRVFARYLEADIDELIGTRLWSLPWDFTDYNGAPIVSLRAPSDDGSVVRGTTMRLSDKNGDLKAIFSVNASPVLDESGKYQGLMAAFADITPLEQSRAQLSNTLSELKESKEEITKQNEELRYLATRDPLTGCLNRRTFFEEFDRLWTDAKQGQASLCALMVDIDFFKSINDNHGHGVGDEVLRKTGQLLNSATRPDDIVCRYGGEEFSILMPGVSLENAEAAAEDIRTRLSELEFKDVSITASLGVSGFSLGAEDPQGLLDQADQCLYVAKRNGRNQVVRFDTVPRDLVVDESKLSREKLQVEQDRVLPSIPYAAVTALLSALTYRDAQTGAHSTRVSNFAAMLAQRLLGPSEVYLIEIAALLHDIGKVGVPDSILLKPGKLTEQEWQIMAKHDRVGVEIINTSFKHQRLTDIVNYHHYHFSGDAAQRQDLQGHDIPIGARILAIVDAFDAMVSDRPYRRGRTVEAALRELRRCAGQQFDPELVQLFIEIVQAGQLSASHATEQRLENEVLLSIGEQIERLVEAADGGDGDKFLALAERLRLTAQQYNVKSIEEVAAHAIASVEEDDQLSTLVQESFELLSVCRVMRTGSQAKAVEELSNARSTEA